jgi:hypothetical protein
MKITCGKDKYQMKIKTLALALLLIAAALVGCSGNPAPASQVERTPGLDQEGEIVVEGSEPFVQAGQAEQPALAVLLAQDYPDALSLRNQLIVGTFRLEGTPLAVTEEQAGELVPLWQLLRALTGTDSSSQLESEAVMVQIQEAMTSEQLLAIQELQLTNTDNQALLESLGISSQATGMGGQGTGQGRNMTEEEKAARRATQGVTEAQVGAAGQGGSRAVLDKLIELLENRQAGL